MKKLAVAISALAIFATPSLAQNRTEAGTLACQMGPTVGLVVGSVQRMACTFTPKAGPVEHYTATFRRVGLDLGIKAGGRMVWAVYARTKALPSRSLAGTYVGASGAITVGLGVGANAMVGGSHDTITLQPLSVEGSAGLNVQLGAAGFKLR